MPELRQCDITRMENAKKRGYFHSEKTKKTQFIRIPYIFNGVKHNYVVDLFVEYTNGEKQLIEIKPSKFLKNDVNIIKFTAAKQFAIRNNMKFDIWTEQELKI